MELRTASGRVAAVGAQSQIPVFREDSLISVFPQNSVGSLTPFLRQLPDVTESYSDEPLIGWLLGAYISDGWISKNILGFTKDNAAIRGHFIKLWSQWSGTEAHCRHYTELHDADNNGGIGGRSTKFHIRLSTSKEKDCADWLRNSCVNPDINHASQGERTCLFKRLPAGFLSYSERMRLAILAGLIDGDGSISLNRSRPTPQVLASFSTSSTYLAEDVPLLLKSLGIKSSVTLVHPGKHRRQTHLNYSICISTTDLHRVMDDIPLVTSYAAWQFLKDSPPSVDRRDVIPFSYFVAKHIQSAAVWEEQFAAQRRSFPTRLARIRNHGCGVASRETAALFAQIVPPESDNAAMKTFRRMIADHSISWDRIVEVRSLRRQRIFEITAVGGAPIALSNGLLC